MATMYASRLGRDPADCYRQIDAAGRTAEADGPGLVQLLYDELVAVLRSTAWAVEHRQFAMRSEKVTRATAILFALEAGLDFDQGGDVSRTLATLYAGARGRIVEASLGSDPRPFLEQAQTFSEIAAAWRVARRG